MTSILRRGKSKADRRLAAPVVIVGLDSTTGLQAARIFAWRGIQVVGVAEDPAHFCCRTRVCQRIRSEWTAAATR